MQAKGLLIYKRFKAFVFLIIISFLTVNVNASSPDTITDRQLLIFSTLCYSNEPLEDACEMISNKTVASNWLKDKIYLSELSEWKVVFYEINDNSNKSGYSVFVFKKEDNVVIAFRGTDGGMFYENWRYLMPLSEHPQAKYASQFIKNLEETSYIDDNSKIYITGHSLGGYLSLYSGGILAQNQSLRNKLIKIVTFNGLGLGSYTDSSITTALYSLNPEQIINYRIDGDAVSFFGNHFTNVISLKFIPIPEIPYNFIYYWAAASHSIYQFFYHEPFMKNIKTN